MDHRIIARLLAGLVAASVALLAPVAAAPAAHASGGGGGDIFRYWAYFHVEDGEYVTSQEGLAGYKPKDGSVEALRFAAPKDFKNPNLPRADLAEVDFETVCADTEAAADEKRVAVLLDFGVEADSEGVDVPEPRAACAAVPQQANALQAVQSIAEARTEESSFGPQLCGVDGYPASGCSESAQSASPADDGAVEFQVAGQETGDQSAETASDGATESEEDGGNVVLYVLIGVVALGLLVGGMALARRRS